MKNILIDAGPIIALFDKRDKYHGKAVDYLRTNSDRLVTSWPVITEVSHMLDFSVEAQIDFLKWCGRGGLRIVDIEPLELHRIIELTQTYSNVPMDLADSSLVVLAERLDVRKIVTIDSDYYIYRTERKEIITNVFL